MKTHLKPGLVEWLKSWGALSVATLALIIAGATFIVNTTHYQELTIPHTLHDEINDRLDRLYERIERTERDLESAHSDGRDVASRMSKLNQVKLLYNQAELAWDRGQYDESNNLIIEAYDVLSEIELAAAMNWWLIGGIIGGCAVVAAIVAVFLMRRRFA
jgi:hypothetical protein